MYYILHITYILYINDILETNWPNSCSTIVSCSSSGWLQIYPFSEEESTVASVMA